MEQWKQIEGYEGLYEVSNYGRVKSLERFITDSVGRRRKIKTKLIKLVLSNRGYYMFTLNKVPVLVHRVVANSFIPNPDNKPQVNHIDGNKQNNHISNLEWCTNSENQSHAINNELKYSILNKEDVIKIKQLLHNKKLTYEEIGNMFGVHRSTIKAIQYNKNWKHI